MFAGLPCIMGLQMILSALLIDIQSVPQTPISRPIFKRRSVSTNEIENNNTILKSFVA
jgi:hypothetical protein